MIRIKPSQTAFGRWLMRKLSQDDLKRFCEHNATAPSDRVLVVHSDDMSYWYCFPNHEKANTMPGDGIDILAERYYYTIHAPTDAYDVVVCTGLLEHVPDPRATIGELHRVLKPGGKAIVSVSGSFSVHNAPENYFQFTTFGLRHLFESEGWEHIDVRPSSSPFRTIGILLQRIAYQTKTPLLFTIALFLLAKVIPAFDVFVKEQYGDTDNAKRYPVDSMLYSNVHLVARKKTEGYPTSSVEGLS